MMNAPSLSLLLSLAAIFASHQVHAEVSLKLASGATVSTKGKWILWPDAGPNKGIPFPKSTEIRGFEFLNGSNANYGEADTWYPSWAADGNLYTPWTDGSVEGVSSDSKGRGPSGNSATGYATIIGDNPFSLNVTNVATFTSSVYPYQGRYPCGSLAYQGKWFYGTYYLNNPNTTSPAGTVGPNPGPNCGNWCVQGPLVDFRVSHDWGKTWKEPRMNASGPSDNLFGETAFNNGKVKFGAPHFVDFGKDMEHSPDGKAYIVAHGARRPEAIQAWMLGDEVYIARIEPTEEAMADRSQWEFYAGSSKGWVKGSVEDAEPILSWKNHMGVVTMSWHPALKKFIMVVSTASHYPSMTREFDTYFLESDSITGPWKYITYLEKFGPEAYFVNFPTKFMAAETGGGFYEGFLSYSANFAFHHGSSPPGSGYHWSLQQMRFALGDRFSFHMQ